VARCEASYRVVNEWPGGFQAEITITATYALSDWRLSWTYGNGQRVQAMWNGNYTQSGGTVSVTPAQYNRQIAAGQALSVGYLGSWDGSNGAPSGIMLNGEHCG
jgi:hypothetical protein